MIDALIYLLIVLLVLGVAWWIISLIPLPPPFGVIAQVVLVLIALLIVINALLGLAPVPLHPLWR